MDAQDHLSGRDGESSSRHSLTRPVAVPDPAPEGDPGAWFAVALRGYDRAQVDARLAELERRISDETRRAETAESALGEARSHARRPPDSTTAAPADERDFGSRVERVLQAAEREASDLREKASAEAATMLDTARAEAEQRRRQTEQALLGRAATLDQEFAARAAALDARERDVDERIATAERDAERIREEAEGTAATERTAAEHRAADLMRHAEDTVRQQQADAVRDVDRLCGLRDEVRGELSRLRELLGGELDRRPVTTALDDDLFGRPAHDVADGADGSGTGDDPLTGKLRIAPAPSTSEDPNERTTIGAIPPFTVSSIGVLPFRDRAVGAIGKARPFTTSGDTPAEDPAEDGGATPAGGVAGTGPGARTSDDAGSPGAGPTRSAPPTRGPR